MRFGSLLAAPANSLTISLKSTGLSFAAQPPERAWLVSLAAVASFIIPPESQHRSAALEGCQSAPRACPPPVSKPSAPCRGSCSLARDLKVPSRPHGAARNRRAPVRSAPQPLLVPTSER